MPPPKRSHFNLQSLLGKVGVSRITSDYVSGNVIFSQGDPANIVYYIQKGAVKLSVVSARGKEAVIAILNAGNFLGEGCLAGQHVRMATATAVGSSTMLKIKQKDMLSVLRNQQIFSRAFIQQMLLRNMRIEADLVDQLFNSSEKRLARALLLIAHYGDQGQPHTKIPKISQETLAEMVGTTRARVSFFMNKFRKLGFIHYNGGLQVHNSLLSVVLHE